MGLTAKKENIPKHVAIIMDGNGRWARRRGLPKMMGHRAGVKSIRSVTEAAAQMGIGVLTLYAFSTENWNRPKREIDALMKLLDEYLLKELPTMNKNNIRLFSIGRSSDLPPNVQDRLKETMEATSKNTGLVLNLALSYGSRSEIVDAVKAIAKDLKDGRIKDEDINEGVFSDYLYTKGLPDPDLLIRTSGEMRISNFLLWQLSYSELYIIDKLWPDFKEKDLKEAISEYNRRERRFGR